MMADPKYQNLPYIAADQPDVYETGDLPESDQAFYETDEQQGTVETLLVDPKDAVKRFNKATVDSSGSNFSEEAVAGRTGYSVHYEILPSVEKDEETILQKLQRLKHELKEVQDAVKSGLSEQDVNPTTIMAEVEQLQHQVELFGTQPLASANTNDSGYGQLLSNLKTGPVASLSPKRKGGKASTGGSETEPNQTLYEVHMSAASQSSKEAHLEARISQIERVLGSANEQKMLVEIDGSNSVMDALATLSSKLHLLDEDNVDKISARLQILLQTLSKVNESSSTDEACNMEKVNELYELVKKWDSCADALPTIVDRLYTLQDLHQQALEFSSSLKALEAAQNELSASMNGHEKLLVDVRKTFSDNVDMIKSNVGNMEKRISALK